MSFLYNLLPFADGIPKLISYVDIDRQEIELRGHAVVPEQILGILGSDERLGDGQLLGLDLGAAVLACPQDGPVVAVEPEPPQPCRTSSAVLFSNPLLEPNSTK